MSRKTLSLIALAISSSSVGFAQDRIAVTVENLAPRSGTFQTPVWIGIHDGSFDIYSSNVPAAGPMSPLGDDSLERLAEDGATGPIAANFLGGLPMAVETTIPGPNGPIAPGDRGFSALLVNPMAPTNRYFSYASMLLPSNDAFVSNGNPLAHAVYDAQGDFVFNDFIVTQVLDAATEVNDELPANTAFFGQMAPNTGVDEGNTGVVAHPGFNPRGSGGILDDFRFRNGDFTLGGYSHMMVRIRRAPAITEDRNYSTFASGANQVPAVATGAGVRVGASLRNDGETLEVAFVGSNLRNVVAAQLHLGAPGNNGPVVATLIGPIAPGGGDFGAAITMVTLTGADLSGPFADYPLDALVAQIDAGNVYFNVHTSDGDPATNGLPGDNPAGEARGPLIRR